MADSKSAPKATGRYERPIEATEFRALFPEEIKPMLDGASVEKVRSVAENWQDVHDELIGKDGKGGIKKTFDDAVAKVLKGWTGDAADKFYVQAQKISKNLENGAPYAQATANAIGAAAEDLQRAITDMLSIDWSPPNVTNQVQTEEMMKKAMRGSGKIPPPANHWEYFELWDDHKGNLNGKIEAYKRAKADMDAGMSTKDVLAKYEDVTGMYGLPFFLRQGLKASAAMEPLAKSYATKAKDLDPPPPAEDGDIPPRDKGGKGGGGNIGGIGDGAGGGDLGGGPGGGIGNMKPGDGADLGGSGKGGLPNLSVDKSPDGTEYKPGSQAATGLESVSGGGGLNPGGGLGSLSTGGGVAGGGAGLGPGAPSGVAGLGGPMGTGASGAGGTAGRGGGRLGAGSGTAGASGAGARGGMAPGMGGAAGAGGAGAGKTGGGQGGLFGRRAGGTVGRSGGGSAADGQGGAGLHRSRGGTGAGGQGARGPGLAGAPGAAGSSGAGRRRKESRPAYLGEEEETWVPKRNVAPRVIE